MMTTDIAVRFVCRLVTRGPNPACSVGHTLAEVQAQLPSGLVRKEKRRDELSSCQWCKWHPSPRSQDHGAGNQISKVQARRPRRDIDLAAIHPGSCYNPRL
jgi:hypothetical protein